MTWNNNTTVSLTWLATMQIYWYKRKSLYKKRAQLPEEWFGTLTCHHSIVLGDQHGYSYTKWLSCLHINDIIIVFNSYD